MVGTTKQKFAIVWYRRLAAGAVAVPLLAGTAAAQQTAPAPGAPQAPTSGAGLTAGPLDPSLMTAPAEPQRVHLLPATLETTQWGWYDNAQPPVLRIHAGNTVVAETMMHSHNQVVPGATIEQIKKLRTDFPGRGPHTITGPIYVEEAEPGDTLKITLNKLVPRAYATNFNVPGMFGEFPKDFPDGQVKYFYLDLDKKQMEFAPGIVIPLRPFPGTIGVARAEPGRYSTVPPGRFGGNMDIRELVVGTALYLPVFVKGALLWTGDSHAGQGNGEINLTAIETAFKEQNMTISVISEQPYHGGCRAADASAMGLPNLRSGRRAEGHLLLQPEGTWHRLVAAAADGRDCGGSSHICQERRFERGDGYRGNGDDQAAAGKEGSHPARRIRPRQRGDGLPARPARRRKGGRLPDAEEPLGGEQVKASRAAAEPPRSIA